MEAGENEITAGLRLLAQLSLEGTIITGDAIFAQKKFAN
ncbi:MAG: transposase [Alphaproteobacteria bacterium]|nr:transposase [Alphaproteobacteria bacterium]